MGILMAIGSVASFIWCGYLCMHLVTDIQLGFAVLAFFIGLILAGLSALLERLERLEG
jgi:hypothetical protein